MNNIDHQTDYELTNSDMASPSQSSPIGASSTVVNNASGSTGVGQQSVATQVFFLTPIYLFKQFSKTASF